MSESSFQSAAPESQSRLESQVGGARPGVNVFRDGWEYRVTEVGAERLAKRSGTSPAFLSILAIALPNPVTFAAVSAAMPHIDRDDLELWLSAMCTMGLLAPVDAGPTAAPVATTETRVAAPPRAVVPSVAATPVLPVALLVHEDVRVRANWRRVLSDRGFDLLEAAQLEAVERILRERRPAWVVLGLKGEDFEGLHLLRALKRPRVPQVSMVCLVVPRGQVLDRSDADTAARADARAASVAEIVRALCGAESLDDADAARIEGDGGSPVGNVSEQEAAPAASARPPAKAPVWMNLLYGDAFKYGSYETDHPSELETRYPRLMVRMIEGWSKPDFSAEIGNLILDDRGDRNGFPAEVMEELWFLHQVHQANHAEDLQPDSRPGQFYALDGMATSGGRGGASTASLSAA